MNNLLNRKLRKPALLVLFVTIAVAAHIITQATEPAARYHHPVKPIRQDAYFIKQYEHEVKKYLIEGGGKLTPRQLEKEFKESGYGLNTTVTYAPDSSFKIFVVEAESCGSSCNSEWFSWVHYNLHDKEAIIKHDFAETGASHFTGISAIYLLPDKTYLFFATSYESPASVVGYHYDHARIISFDKQGMISHPLKYNGANSFTGCTSSNVWSEIEEEENTSFLRYDTAAKTITFRYGKNYGYSNGQDIDTIREGRFQYSDGEFLLEKEVITILDRRSKEERE